MEKSEFIANSLQRIQKTLFPPAGLTPAEKAYLVAELEHLWMQAEYVGKVGGINEMSNRLTAKLNAQAGVS